MYECNMCKYSTKRSTDLERHNKTKRHMMNLDNYEDINIEKTKNINNNNTVKKILTKFDKRQKNNAKNKEYKCVCLKVFKSRQSLWYHKKVCDQYEITNDVIFEMKNKIKNLEDKLDNTTLAINSNNTSNNNSNNNSNNVMNINILTYANKNYTKAKPLETLKQQDAMKLLTNDKSNDHTIEDIIIFNYEKRIFDQFIGDIIIKEYKKDDPQDQQIWASDMARLSFIVRRILDKNDDIWIKDKKGTSLIKMVITPILEETKKIMTEYMPICCSIIEKANARRAEKITEKMFNMGKIIYDINTKEVHPKVLKYISPHFKLDI